MIANPQRVEGAGHAVLQISDHLPLWVELKIDFSRDYLGRKAKA